MNSEQKIQHSFRTVTFKPELNHEEIVKLSEKKIEFDSGHDSSFSDYIEKNEACYKDFFNGSFVKQIGSKSKNFEFIIVTNQEKSISINNSIVLLDALKYKEVTLMDLLHFSLTAGENMYLFDGSIKYLLATKTRTEKKGISWSCIPRLNLPNPSINKKARVSDVSWNSFEHFDEYGILGYKII